MLCPRSYLIYFWFSGSRNLLLSIVGVLWYAYLVAGGGEVKFRVSLDG